MPKVWCAEITCRYNNKNQCAAEVINLSTSDIATAHEGRQHFWKCRKYDISEEYAELIKQVSDLMGKKG